MRKTLIALTLSLSMITATAIPAFAGQWKQQVVGDYQTGFVYENSDGTYAKNGWQWIDGKCYYFDENGVMLASTTTPDGYRVDTTGAWIMNGEVQTQAVEYKTDVVDPAHPLAGKIDEWDLRLPKTYIGYKVIVNDNVQALLTGQMDQYYIPPAGYSVNPTTGTQMYVSQEDYDANVKTTQALYNWFCDWLNSIDFENMTEMEKAKEIQKVLSQGINIGGEMAHTRNAEYSVLIDKQGMCAEYAMTALSLAKAIGLKSAVSGTGSHAVYYIQVDGIGYFGQNNMLNLNSPTPDYVYFSD